MGQCSCFQEDEHFLSVSLLLVAMPFAPSSFLFLVVRPGAPSSVIDKILWLQVWTHLILRVRC